MNILLLLIFFQRSAVQLLSKGAYRVRASASSKKTIFSLPVTMLVTIYIYHKNVTTLVTKPPYAVNAKLKIVYLILEQSISCLLRRKPACPLLISQK
jgi:hypothetical protein